MCSLCFSAGLYGLSNVPSSVNSSPWTKKAGYTDSICCNKDNPVSNCGTSGGWHWPPAQCAPCSYGVQEPGTTSSSRAPRPRPPGPPPPWATATGAWSGVRGAVVTETAARWCGRWMALPADPAPTPTITYSAVNSGTTLCSRLLPFRLRVMFDDGEVRLSAPGSWLTPQNIPPCRCSARTAARCAGPAAPRRARRTPRTSAPPSGCTAAARGRSASSSSGGTSAASSRL